MAEVSATPAPIDTTASSADASAVQDDGGPAPHLTVAQREFVERCKLAEHADRFEDMATIVKLYVTSPETGAELSMDERNLFSIAYKNVVGVKRSAWRVVKAIEDQIMGNNNSANGATGGPSDIERKKIIAREYRQKISGELVAVANEVIDLLDHFLIQRTEDPEAKVFFLKMKADYYRYLAEVTLGEEQAEATANARTAYAEAVELAKAQMTATHPIRLGLVLNYSVFFYEILQNKEEAQVLAKQAFDSAIQELDSLSEDSYKDSTMVLQLIRDNLTLWANENAAAATEGESEADEPPAGGALEADAAASPEVPEGEEPQVPVTEEPEAEVEAATAEAN